MSNQHRPSISSAIGHLALRQEEDSEDEMPITRSMTSRASQPVEVQQGLDPPRYHVGEVLYEYHVDFSPRTRLRTATEGEAERQSIFSLNVQEGERAEEAYTIAFTKLDMLRIRRASPQHATSSIDCTCGHFTQGRACVHVFWAQDQVFRAYQAVRSNQRDLRARKVMLRVSESGQQLAVGRPGRQLQFLPPIDRLIDDIGHETLEGMLNGSQVDEDTDDAERLGKFLQPTQRADARPTWNHYGRRATQRIAQRFRYDVNLRDALLDEEKGIFNMAFQIESAIEYLTDALKSRIATLDASTHDEHDERVARAASRTDKDVAELIRQDEKHLGTLLENSGRRSNRINRAALDFLFLMLKVVCQRHLPQLANGRSRDLFGHLIRRDPSCSFVIRTIRGIRVPERDVRFTFDRCSEISGLLGSLSELETQDSATYRYWMDWRQWTSRIQRQLEQ